MHEDVYDAIKVDLFSQAGELKGGGVDAYRSPQANQSGIVVVLLRDDHNNLNVIPSDVLRTGGQSLQVVGASSDCTSAAPWRHHNIWARELPEAEFSEKHADEFLDLDEGAKRFYAIRLRMWAGETAFPEVRHSIYLDESTARQTFNSLRRDALSEARLHHRQVTRCEVVLCIHDRVIDSFSATN
jgi:hypothetical protein